MICIKIEKDAKNVPKDPQYRKHHGFWRMLSFSGFKKMKTKLKIYHLKEKKNAESNHMFGFTKFANIICKSQ